MLTAAGKTTDIRVRGSVESNYRTAYDILVRPEGSALPLEREQSLVRNNYLSGLFGGITLAQYRQIKGIRGVEIAAPIANIGYVIPSGSQSFTMNRLFSREPVQLYRIVFTTTAHAGTSRYPLGTSYVYYTRRHRFAVVGGLGAGYGEVVPGQVDPVPVCSVSGLLIPPGPNSPSETPFWRAGAASVRCYSARSPGYGSDRDTPGVVREGKGISFPILLGAIDPVEESRLLRLDRAIVAGRYLRKGEESRLQLLRGPGRFYHRLVPVIASTKTFVDERVEARVERLRIPPGANVPRELASEPLRFLTALRGNEIAQRTFSARAMYDNLLAGIIKEWSRKSISHSYWTASPVQYRSFTQDKLVPRVETNPLSVWRSAPTPGYSGYTDISEANADLQFRRLHPRIGSPFFNREEVRGGEVLNTPTMNFVGRYDPTRLPGFSPLSEVPLETYYPPQLSPGDEASRRALRGQPLLPSTNIGDYVAQPPLFLTTLEAMRPFLNSKYYAGANGRAPISVIRVRVRGVSGADELSQARVRAVATEIHDRTGLQVDITAGSSPRRLLVQLPPGRFGRPALLLEEGWSKKGVSVSFLQALDRKRLGLLSLILVTCTFFLANGAFAAVRGRRREIGTLLCLGWPRKAIFGAVLSELILVGAGAGLAAAGVASLVANVLSLDLSVLRTVLVVPLGVALATVAGIVPAWWAARSVALDAVQPAVSMGAVRRPVRRLISLAAANVRRVPARSLVAAGGLFIAASALTLLLAINQAFQGRLVGTLLGEAISLDVRGLDFVVVGVILILAGLSVADVIYLNLKERAAEIVTLRTVGWSDGHLARVIAWEAGILGTLGSVPGSLLGLIVGLQFDIPPLPLLAAAAASVLGGILVALLASLVPLLGLSGVATPSVLAEE